MSDDQIDRLAKAAKYDEISDETWLRLLHAADAGLGAHIDEMTEHINKLLNELGPPPGWNETTGGA